MQDKPIKLTKLTKSVQATYLGGQVSLPTELSEKINTYWEQRLRENPHLFNGDTFTMVSYTETPEAIEVELAASKFAHSLYSAHNDAGEYAYKVFHTACLVVTSDNKLVLGKMGKNTARADIICCSGGGIDRGDIRGDSIDLDHSTIHELREELGIDPLGEHAVSFGPVYIKTGGYKDMITVLYELQIDLDSRAFAQMYAAFTAELAKHNEEIEFERLFYVDNTPAAIEAFITEHADYLDAYLLPLLRTVSQSVTQ
jgi:hypothetical protein